LRADLAHFARTGTCDWRAYGLAGRTTMLYDLKVGAADDPAGSERELWDGVV